MRRGGFRLPLAALALLLALLAAIFVSPNTRSGRFANLDVAGPGLDELFLQTETRRPGQLKVTDRQGSTVRRSDDPDAGNFLDYRVTQSDVWGEEHWLVVSRRGRSFLLAPVLAVPDWGFPYLYEFARDHGGKAEIPRLRWVNLYVDRIYRGVFLELMLPREPDGGDSTSAPVELLVVTGDHMMSLDHRFGAVPGAYANLVSAGRFPEAVPPSPLVAWLLDRASVPEHVYVLEPTEPYALHPLPLGISLREEYRNLHGREGPTTLDHRFERWGSPAGGAFPWSDAQGDSLRAGWTRYRDRLAGAVLRYGEFANAVGSARQAVRTHLDEGKTAAQMAPGAPPS